MNILIADNFPPSHLSLLGEAGHRITFEPNLEGAALGQALAEHGADHEADYEILIVRGTKVDAATLDAGASLRLVIRAGAGTNSIDKAHAAAKGVRVCNVPGANAIAVAELVMGLIIAIDRNIAGNIIDLRNQRWDKRLYGKAGGLYGLTIGILGLGAIGLAVAQRAHAFGLRVCTVARKTRREPARVGIATWDITEFDSLDELIKQSDIISLHLPLSGETERLVDDAFLAKMKNGAMLINTARGELLDEAALIRAMDDKGIRAGLDVYQNEPASGEGVFESALANHPGVCGTHHIGASTEQAQIAVADGVLRVIESYEKGALLYCVNE